MNSVPPKQVRISPNQIQILAQFMENHSDIATGRLAGTQSKLRETELWTELVSHLNSDAMGAVKTTAKWEKCWQDMRRKTRTKVAAIRLYRTGSGFSPPTPLTEADVKIARAIGILDDSLLPQDSLRGSALGKLTQRPMLRVVDAATLTSNEPSPITWIPVADPPSILCAKHSLEKPSVDPLEVRPVDTQDRKKRRQDPSTAPQVFHASAISYVVRKLTGLPNTRKPHPLAVINTDSSRDQRSSADVNKIKEKEPMNIQEVKQETMITISEQLKRIADSSERIAEFSERKAVALEKLANFFA